MRVPDPAAPGQDLPPRLDARGRHVVEVAAWLRRRLADDGAAELVVHDPDAGPAGGAGDAGAGSGPAPRLDLRAWLDLADAVGARLRTPRSASPGGAGADDALRLRFERRAGESDVHADGGRPADRYALDGDFARVRKPDLPGFVLPLLEAVAFAAPTPPRRVLIAGCHRGDELDALDRAAPPIPPSRVTGVDRQADALDEARRRHPRARFVQADLRELPPDLGRFDLILAVAVLQSPELDGPAVLRALVRDHAAPAGGLTIGLPNSRFVGGDVVWGARTRNYAEVDLSLVVRDLAGHRRYLHQQGYRTRIGGRYDLLLAARR